MFLNGDGKHETNVLLRKRGSQEAFAMRAAALTIFYLTLAVALVSEAKAEGCAPRYVDGEVRNCACVFNELDYSGCRSGEIERCKEIASCAGANLTSTPVVEAAARGDVAAVRKAFATIVESERQPACELALITAVQIGHLAVAETLLDLGTSPNTRDPHGRSTMLLPNGYRLPMLRLLLDRGMDPNAVAGAGISALLMATHDGLRAEAKLLLERGADPNLTTHITGASALIYAASHGDDELVRLLLDHGADPDHKRQAGQTAADVAREQGFEDIARMLEGRMRAPSISETPGSDR